MRDLAEKWTAMPDWQTGAIDAPGLAIRSVSGLNQFLVSGDLTAWSRASDVALQPVGAFGTATGDTYTVQVARDRLLVVSHLPSAVAQGWHAQGFAVTTLSAGMLIFEIEGPAAAELVARATTLDPGKASASAAISFAGINAVVYRHGEKLRVHIDRSLAPYFWTWAATVGGNIPSAKA